RKEGLLMEQVGELEGAQGTAWRCAKAARAVERARRGERAGLAEARRLVGEARQRRPGLAQAVFLEAQIDEAEGRAAQAVANYSRLLALGDYRPAALRRL